MSQRDSLHDYLNKNIKPVFDKLIARLLIERPDNVYDFSIDWLANERSKGSFRAPSSRSEHHHEPSDDDNGDESEEEVAPKKNNFRVSVSAEVYGHFNKLKDFKPRVIPKSADQEERIKNRILNSFMFQALDDRELQIVLNAMEEKKFHPGDLVIKQGADGNELFVIDEGQLECYKQFSSDPPKLLRTYQPGESFGELALLYNAPRAATIKAVTETVAFALDRDTFNNIVKQSAIKKREQMEKIFSKIELLQDIKAYERFQLTDVMREVKYKAGETVIVQDEVGDKIYLIIEGKLEAWKKSDGVEEKVYSYSDGDYFGELALLKSAPRSATVKTLTDCRLLYCDYHSFRRLMGPLEQILQRNMVRYNHQ